jgi:hypothetical protein
VTSGWVRKEFFSKELKEMRDASVPILIFLGLLGAVMFFWGLCSGIEKGGHLSCGVGFLFVIIAIKICSSEIKKIFLWMKNLPEEKKKQ